jgi:hypothetical protein
MREGGRGREEGRGKGEEREREREVESSEKVHPPFWRSFNFNNIFWCQIKTTYKIPELL